MDNLYSEEVEKNILGILLVHENTRRYLKIINQEDFYIQQNKTIYSIMTDLYSHNYPIDILSIKEAAKDKKYDGKEIFDYLIKLTEIVVTSADIDYYVRKLKNYSTRRAIERTAKEIIEDMHHINSDEDAGEIKKDCMEKIANIKTLTANTKQEEMKDIIAEAVGEIEKRAIKKEDNKYETGFYKLDMITDGLHEQEFTIVAARPGIGKTSFALNIAENISKKGVYTYFVSLEMSKLQVGNRMIASNSSIDSHKLRKGWLDDEDWQKIALSATELADLKILLDAESKTIQEIETRAIELKETKNMGLIIVDYLQLLKSKEKFNIREQEVADISRKLKLLSRDLCIPVIALCQLNRETEKRKRPALSDLRESGSLEQDADNVIFLHVDEEEKIKQYIMDIQVIVAKQRNGPTGEIQLKFNKKAMKFMNKE